MHPDDNKGTLADDFKGVRSDENGAMPADNEGTLADDFSHILIYALGRSFLAPYLRREMPAVAVLCDEDEPGGAAYGGSSARSGADGDSSAHGGVLAEALGSLPRQGAAAVMLSSADIYGGGELTAADESTPVDTASPWHALESDFAARCKAAGVPYAVLRCPDIVGTGMVGFVRELAEAIWKGSFFHFPGNEARRSAVHAVDVAVAARLAAGLARAEGCVYNIAGAADPTVHDLAEALAFRMKNKRVSTLSTGPQQWFGRLVYGRRRYASYTTTRTVSSAAFARDAAFEPCDVCQYMRTHNYDDASL